MSTNTIPYCLLPRSRTSIINTPGAVAAPGCVGGVIYYPLQVSSGNDTTITRAAMYAAGARIARARTVVCSTKYGITYI